MFTSLGILIALTCIAIIYLVVCFAIEREKKFDAEWQQDAPRRAHLATKADLNRVRPYDRDTTHDPQAAESANLKFLGVAAVHAGNILSHVPSLEPKKAIWDDNQVVLSTARLTAYSPYGRDVADLIELGHGYLVMSRRKKVLVLKEYPLTTTEAAHIQREFQEAVDKSGPTPGYIESFAGNRWEIGSALGKNISPKSGERACGSIQVLSIHPDLGQADKISMFPPTLLEDKQEHDCYDLRAHCEATGQVLLAFYTAGSWACYIGRELEQTEVDEMQGI